MARNRRGRMHMADPLVGHLVRARTAADWAGFHRTSALIEQALCIVMAEYHGDDQEDEPEREVNVA